MFDWIGNGISMELSTFIINVILIVRHLIQRHRMKRSLLTAAGRQEWVRIYHLNFFRCVISRMDSFDPYKISFVILQHRSVKLCIQLIAIALLYVIGWIPYSIIVLIQMFQYSDRLAYILSSFFAYLPYLQSLLLPYVCILFMPEIKKKFFALFTSSARLC